MKDATGYDYAFGANPDATKGATKAPRLFWTADVPFNPDAPVAGQPIEAFVNEGRWVVSCPAPHCGGAQLAALDDPRFMCVTCGNQLNGGAWLPVAFPPDLPAIVEALDVRGDDPVKQNWVPGESVADLLEENRTLDDKKEKPK